MNHPIWLFLLCDQVYLHLWGITGNFFFFFFCLSSAMKASLPLMLTERSYTCTLAAVRTSCWCWSFQVNTQTHTHTIEFLRGDSCLSSFTKASSSLQSPSYCAIPALRLTQTFRYDTKQLPQLDAGAVICCFQPWKFQFNSHVPSFNELVSQ